MACCGCLGPSSPSSADTFSPHGKKYSRELQSFSELIYDAGGREESRLGGYGSTLGLLRKRTHGPGAYAGGGTYEQHGSAVDDLQDTLRDMSRHERDKLLRTDLLLLAPVVRELFPLLPETHYTYVLPYADDLDEKASDYLGSVLECIRVEQGATVVPLQTTGDGNCLLHAASRGIWGVELFSELLRHRVADELEDNRAWYESKLSPGEVSEALEQVRQPYRFLSNLHIVALAHVVRRPIVLYACHVDVLDFGCGYYGMAGFFGPTRYDVDSWNPRPLAIGWSSRQHNHFVPLVWSASQGSVEWPVQDEGPKAPQMSRTKSFDMHDPFAVPPEHRALLRARARVAPIVRPIFVQRLVEQIRQQVVQLQGHMLARMLDSGAFDKSSDEEEEDWASVPLKPPPASSIALSFAPYEEPAYPPANGRKHAFAFERQDQNGGSFEPPPSPPFKPAFFENPVYNPTKQTSSAGDPFQPAATNPFLNQYPRSGTSYSDSTPVSWPPPKYPSPASGVTQTTVQHVNLSRHVGPSSEKGSLSAEPHVYSSENPEPSQSSSFSETSPRGNSRPADSSPKTPRRSSVLTPLSELNPLTTPTSFLDDIASPTDRTAKEYSHVDNGPIHTPSYPSADMHAGGGAKRHAANEPLAAPVSKRPARLLSAVPGPSSEAETPKPAPPKVAQKRWRVASTTVRGAVRMKRAALAVIVELPEGFGGLSGPWWKPKGDAGRLKVLEGEDPYIRAQAISRSLSKRIKAPQSERQSTVSEAPRADASALTTVPHTSGALIKRASGDALARSGKYLKDGRGRLVWVSLAQQITRKMDGVAVADAALQRLTKPCPTSRYAAAASRQPEIALLAATLVRLAAEYRLLTAKPLPGIHVSLPDDDDLFLWHATLDGPPGTPWEGGSYQLEIHVPEDYPRKPPDRVRFLSKLVHPNVDQTGVPYLGFLHRGGVNGAGPSEEHPPVWNGQSEERCVEPEASGVKADGQDSATVDLTLDETGRSGNEHGGGIATAVDKSQETTTDEIVVAAERLLSTASLDADDDECEISGHGEESEKWDPYQGLAFVLTSVQRLFWTVDMGEVVNGEAAALYRENEVGAASEALCT